MPFRRPRPVHLNAAPRRKMRPAPKSSRRPRGPRKTGGNSALVYGIAAGLVMMLVGIVALYFAAPKIKSWLVGRQPPRPAATYTAETASASKPVPAPKPVSSPLSEEQKLKEKANAEAQKIVQTPAPK